MKCPSCAADVPVEVSKGQWLLVFGLIYAAEAVIEAAQMGFWDSTGAALIFTLLHALGFSSALFVMSFVLSLLASPRRQLKACSAVALAPIGLMSYGR